MLKDYDMKKIGLVFVVAVLVLVVAGYVLLNVLQQPVSPPAGNEGTTTPSGNGGANDGGNGGEQPPVTEPQGNGQEQPAEPSLPDEAAGVKELTEEEIKAGIPSDQPPAPENPV